MPAAPAPLKNTPARDEASSGLLPEMMLRAPGAAPPMVLLGAPLTRMPCRPLPRLLPALSATKMS